MNYCSNLTINKKTCGLALIAQLKKVVTLGRVKQKKDRRTGLCTIE